jgi:hypothetical protein
VIANLKSGTSGYALPTTERQVRELIILQPDQQRTVWSHAVNDSGGDPSKVTAARLEALAAPLKPARERQPSEDE